MHRLVEGQEKKISKAVLSNEAAAVVESTTLSVIIPSSSLSMEIEDAKEMEIEAISSIANALKKEHNKKKLNHATAKDSSIVDVAGSNQGGGVGLDGIHCVANALQYAHEQKERERDNVDDSMNCVANNNNNNNPTMMRKRNKSSTTLSSMSSGDSTMKMSKSDTGLSSMIRNKSQPSSTKRKSTRESLKESLRQHNKQKQPADPKRASAARSPRLQRQSSSSKSPKPQRQSSSSKSPRPSSSRHSRGVNSTHHSSSNAHHKGGSSMRSHRRHTPPRTKSSPIRGGQRRTPLRSRSSTATSPKNRVAASSFSTQHTDADHSTYIAPLPLTAEISTNDDGNKSKNNKSEKVSEGRPQERSAARERNSRKHHHGKHTQATENETVNSSNFAGIKPSVTSRRRHRSAGVTGHPALHTDHEKINSINGDVATENASVNSNTSALNIPRNRRQRSTGSAPHLRNSRPHARKQRTTDESHTSGSRATRGSARRRLRCEDTSTTRSRTPNEHHTAAAETDQDPTEGSYSLSNINNDHSETQHSESNVRSDSAAALSVVSNASTTAGKTRSRRSRPSRQQSIELPDNMQPRDELRFIMEILSCRDLLIADSTGASDPYVRVKVGNKFIHQTKHIVQTLNPKFTPETGSLFAFHCTAKQLFDAGGLMLRIKDWDAIGFDDELGDVPIPADLLCEMTGDPVEYKIKRPRKQRNVRDGGDNAGFVSFWCKRATDEEWEKHGGSHNSVALRSKLGLKAKLKATANGYKQALTNTSHHKNTLTEEKQSDDDAKSDTDDYNKQQTDENETNENEMEEIETKEIDREVKEAKENENNNEPKETSTLKHDANDSVSASSHDAIGEDGICREQFQSKDMQIPFSISAKIIVTDDDANPTEKDVVSNNDNNAPASYSAENIAVVVEENKESKPASASIENDNNTRQHRSKRDAVKQKITNGFTAPIKAIGRGLKKEKAAVPPSANNVECEGGHSSDSAIENNNTVNCQSDNSQQPPLPNKSTKESMKQSITAPIRAITKGFKKDNGHNMESTSTTDESNIKRADSYSTDLNPNASAVKFNETKNEAWSDEVSLDERKETMYYSAKDMKAFRAESKDVLGVIEKSLNQSKSDEQSKNDNNGNSEWDGNLRLCGDINPLNGEVKIDKKKLEAEGHCLRGLELYYNCTNNGGGGVHLHNIRKEMSEKIFKLQKEHVASNSGVRGLIKQSLDKSLHAGDGSTPSSSLEQKIAVTVINYTKPFQTDARNRGIQDAKDARKVYKSRSGGGHSKKK